MGLEWSFFSFHRSILLLRFKLHRAFSSMPWMHCPIIDIKDASYAVACIATTSLISLQQLLIGDSITFPYHFTIFFSDWSSSGKSRHSFRVLRVLDEESRAFCSSSYNLRLELIRDPPPPPCRQTMNRFIYV